MLCTSSRAKNPRIFTECFFKARAIFEHCNFFQNGFDPPKGNKLYSYDPLFKNPNNGDFEIDDNSPIRKLGKKDYVLKTHWNTNLVSRWKTEYDVSKDENETWTLTRKGINKVTIFIV